MVSIFYWLIISTVMYQAPQNALPEDIRAILDFANFRKQLKTDYISLAFNIY